MEGFYSIGEAIKKYIDYCQTKAQTKWFKLLIKAVMAGAFIALGAAISGVASHAVENVGLAKLTAAVVFPVGLMMVVLFGAELFTSDCLFAMNVFDKKQKISAFLRLLVIVYIGNFIGSILIALLISLSGQLDYSSGMLGAYTIKVALGKVNISFPQGVASGILCNILVCGASIMMTCAKDIAGKLLACFFVIMLFVTGGFEHCVANMYYITAGLIADGNPEYANLAINAYGFSADYMSTLNVANFFVKNLLPVTIGNILGGSLFIGLPMFYLNKSKKEN